MGDRVARLRFWLAGSAFLLIAVIVGFIGYGRYRLHFGKMKLPLPPGVNIVREAGGWTYSRANGSRTLYTVHAAGFQQGRDGKTALHEVSMVLFGKNGDRHDRVYGHDFEYDEKNGVMRAVGQVHIDLESAKAAKAVGQEGESSTVEGPEGEESLAPDVVHVTTSGLVYLDKLGIAATSEDVDVQTGQMKGHARGADYSSDTGMLMLHSAVTLSGVSGGHDVRITAQQAQFEQPAQVARLTNATYESEGKSIAAEHAVLHRRTNGTLGSVDAEGNVTLTDGGGKAVARTAELRMDPAGQPESAVLAGGITYAGNEPLRQVRAEAKDAEVSFAETGKRDPDHAVFTGAVHFTERIRADKTVEAWSTREVAAEKLETWMRRGSARNMQLDRAEATGNAKFVSVDAAREASRTEIAADELKAAMSRNGAVGLDRLTGNGHTVVTQMTKDGVQQTSTGDTLDARFAAVTGLTAKAKRASTNIGTSTDLTSAVQEGHVAVTRRIPPHLNGAKRQVAEEIQRAVAGRATYDGKSNQLTLSEAVRMSDAASTVWARQIAIDRTTGDAHALGPVKVDYVGQSGSSKQVADAMHIVAEHADVDGANSTAMFHGNPVRVWQGGNQIQAPEVQVERDERRLMARGTGDSVAVRTILESAPGSGGTGQQSGAAQPGCGAVKQVSAGGSKAQVTGTGAVRVASAGLVYSGVSRQVEFTGGVRADTPDATLRAAKATAFLSGDRGKASSGFSSFEGELERLVANGSVEIALPRTRASGDKLTYDAAGRIFMLSGIGQEPAKAMDARGTTTAAAFRFGACDDTLEAMGEAPGVSSQRVETEAAASGANKKEKPGR